MSLKNVLLAIVLHLPVAATVSAAELRLVLDPVLTVPQRQARALLLRSRVLNDVVSVVNQEFRLPADVTLRIGGKDGPLYDPRIREIIVPYVFVDEVSQRITDTATDLSAEERDAIVVGVVEHTLYHELGHALVDLLELSLAQKEEDAVDTLATILIVESFEDGEHTAVDAMEDFLALDTLGDGSDTPDFFAEHSMDIERYENGVCLAYGSNPDAHPDLVEELGAQTARECVELWKRERAWWFRRLRPVLRTGGEFAASDR